MKYLTFIYISMYQLMFYSFFLTKRLWLFWREGQQISEKTSTVCPSPTHHRTAHGNTVTNGLRILKDGNRISPKSLLLFSLPQFQLWIAIQTASTAAWRLKMAEDGRGWSTLSWCFGTSKISPGMQSEGHENSTPTFRIKFGESWEVVARWCDWHNKFITTSARGDTTTK